MQAKLLTLDRCERIIEVADDPPGYIDCPLYNWGPYWNPEDSDFNRWKALKTRRYKLLDITSKTLDDGRVVRGALYGEVDEPLPNKLGEFVV